jgi:hypothetical protein
VRFFLLYDLSVKPEKRSPITSQREFGTEADVERITGRKKRTLQKDRCFDRGFPFYKIGRSILYDLDEIRSLVRAGRSSSRTPLGSGAAVLGQQRESELTGPTLNPDQRRTADIVEALVFGLIEGLLIRGGSPCYEQEPRLIQTIKLDSELERQSDRDSADLTLKKEFISLFGHLRRLGEAIVDIEVRHGAPFKLAVVRRYTELL